MKRTFAFAAVALALVAGSVSAAELTQLEAAAGVSPAEAGVYSVGELARMKRNAETGRDEQAPIVTGGGAGGAGRSQLIAAAGLTAAEAADVSVAELAIAKSNREARGDDVHPVVSSRSVSFASAGRAQIVASVFADADAADGLTMHEIYRAKIAREMSDD